MPALPHLELVTIETDTFPLDGLLYRPAGEPNGVSVLILHGNCMNFYTGPSRFLPPVLTANGFTCLTFNRRGHDILATLNSREPVGGAFQRIGEAVMDTVHAARWLDERGFAPPVLVGHSNGGMLAALHCADAPQTPALVLLSAHSGGREMVPLASRAGLLAKNRLEEITATAREMVASGRGRELMLLPGWWYAATPESFLDFCDCAPETVDLAPRIRCPSLYVRGSLEPVDLYPAEAFAEQAAGPCTVKIVDGADHFYTGGEGWVADFVRDWLLEEVG